MKNLFIFFIAILFISPSCTKQRDPVGHYYNGQGNNGSRGQEGREGEQDEEKDICHSESFHLSAGYVQPGWMKIKTGQEETMIEFSVECPWYISESYLYAGDCEEIPLNLAGGANIPAFPYKTVCAKPQETNSYIIPFTQMDSCFCVVAMAVVVRSVDGMIQEEQVWAGDMTYHSCCNCELSAIIDYCVETCDESDVGNHPDSCYTAIGDFRTQTQGGWGSDPEGDNPGTYLHDNFAAAFPSGLNIGCNYTVTFTNATSITDFLPQGGTPEVLTQSYTDPTVDINVLAGQLMALGLSLGFDTYDADFGNSAFYLGDLLIASGPLTGLTVKEVYDEGNKILGDCTSAYDINDIHEALSKINQNFVDGTMDGAYLDCP